MGSTEVEGPVPGTNLTAPPTQLVSDREKARLTRGLQDGERRPSHQEDEGGIPVTESGDCDACGPEGAVPPSAWG